MSQIVVDTDVASYIFNWHSSAQHYSDALQGSELVLSFMSIAELRMGAISAGWGNRRRGLLEQFIHGFELSFADNDLCTIWARVRVDARLSGRPLSPQDAWIAATALALDALSCVIGNRASGPTARAVNQVLNQYEREFGIPFDFSMRRSPSHRTMSSAMRRDSSPACQ
ncbi:MAG: PIN domain-containing protein [Bryobacteraceae bacterium]